VAAPARLVGGAVPGLEPAASDEAADTAFVTAPAALDDALARLRPGGTALLFAAAAAPQPVVLDRLYRNELTLVGSRSATPASLRAALDLLAGGRVAVEDLVTDRLPLEQFAEGLDRYRSRAALKVVFTP
jgi:L-iditol 2-dehydrogenase